MARVVKIIMRAFLTREEKKAMKIIFDMDDVLWSLMGTICTMHNININNITRFSIPDCDMLSDEEKQVILKSFKDINTFRQIPMLPSACRIKRLVKTGHDVYVYSHSLAPEIAEYKTTKLKELGLDNQHIQCTCIVQEHATSADKGVDYDTDIFIDDSIHNINRSNAKQNIIINRPWNTSGEDKLDKTNIKRYASLCELMDDLEKLPVRNEV